MEKQSINLGLLEQTKGLYSKALTFLEPGKCDNFSVISGSILLMIGLEKLTKSALYNINPLAILLDKIVFDDIVKLTKNKTFENRNTISFEESVKRIIEIYPNLRSHHRDLQGIIQDRNLLMHNFGYLQIGKLEGKVQTKVADFTEDICKECYSSTPQEVIGLDIWSKLDSHRNAYKKAETLALESRIQHLKRLYSQGQLLPCEEVELPPGRLKTSIICPVCEGEAAVAFLLDYDVDVDHREEIILGVSECFIPLILKCACGFTLKEEEELDIVIEDFYDDIYEELIQEAHES